MLQRQYRLRKRKSFNYIYRTGSRVSTPSLSVVYVPNNLKTPKIGFVVSKKIGKAHTRNLIKRRLRAATRANIALVSPKYNYVFVARPTIIDLSYQDIEQTIIYLLQKVTKN